MKKLEKIRYLKETKNILGKYGWGRTWKDNDGHYCLVGAFNRAFYNDDNRLTEFEQVWDSSLVSFFVKRENLIDVGMNDDTWKLIDWQDKEETTQEDVFELLDEYRHELETS